MKAVVHVGLPKTGTTSIQRFLRANAAALAARGAIYSRVPNGRVPPQDSQLEYGICALAIAGDMVPNRATRAAYGLDDLAAAGDFAARYMEAVQEDVRSHRGAELYLVSSEHLGAWMRSPAHLEALDGWLGSLFSEVRYVLYVRRQEDRILSLYSQALRAGSTEGLGTFVRAHLRLDYHEVAALWAGALGRERFDLRLLERDAMAGGDLIEDYCAAAGIDPEGLERPERENEALSVAAATFLRELNRRLEPRGGAGPRSNPMMKGVQGRLTRWYAADRKLRLSPRQVATIREANAETNARLCAEFFPKRKALFPERPVAAEPDPRGNDPTPEEMARIAIDLLEALRTGEMPVFDARELERYRSLQARRAAPEGAKG